MKTYNITVNGTTYVVQVEEVEAGSAQKTPAPMPKKAPSVPKPSVKAGSVSVKAPMPGNIIKINVKAGDSVKRGDVLCILEAMKMENEIFAPSDGTVASVEITQGATVATDAVLVTLD